MGKIYIASKNVTGGEVGDAANREHLYLVYAPHDVVDTDAQVIRGGPIESMGWSGAFEADHGNIFIDAGTPLVESDDNFFDTAGENPGTQNFTELKLPAGQTHEAVWANLIAYAKSMGSYNSATQRVETPLDYAILGPNSNGTIGSILSGGAGINIHDTLPQKWGPGGATIPAKTFTGLEDFYVTGAGPKTITISDAHTKTFYDAGVGDTTVVLDATKIRPGGVTLYADNLAETSDKLAIKGLTSSSVRYFTPNGTDLFVTSPEGKVLARLPGQLSSPNKYNGIEFQNPDGTTAYLPLPQKLSDLPVWTPVGDLLDLLPSWLGPVVGMQGGRGVVSFSYSPLILDLNGDGAHSTGLGYGSDRSGVYFDMDNDGFAERTGWVAAGDGLLALDKNGNGKIDNQGELFGDTRTASDGFANLRQYDSNGDHKITISDAQFGNLRVWVDADGDGQTDSGELKTLSALGITQINLGATALSGVSDRENRVSASSTFVMGGTTREIADHWFRVEQANSHYTGDVALDARTLFLPTLKGVGNLKDLHVAMSEDPVLLAMVRELSSSFRTSVFKDGDVLTNQIKSILWRWAGLDGEMTGEYDTRINGFLEKLTGTSSAWLTEGGEDASAAVTLSQSLVFSYALKNITALLVAQMGGDVFFDNLSYNPGTGGFSSVPTLSATAAQKIQADLALCTTNTEEMNYWSGISSYLGLVKDIGSFSPAEIAAIEGVWNNRYGMSWMAWVVPYAVTDGPIWSFTGTDHSDLLVGREYGTCWIYGNGGDDIIHGRSSSSGGISYLFGGDGNDQLFGGNAGDALNGDAGDDTIYGGKGRNFITGASGNDTYVYGGGEDEIREGGGNDKIVLGTAYLGSAITFARDPLAIEDLEIRIGGAGLVRIQEHFVDWTDLAVETLVLPDSTILDLRQFRSVNGTSGNDTLSGLDLSLLKDDLLIGNAGNDALSGLLGNDILDGGEGSDTLTGGAGDDTLWGGEGNDTYVYTAGSGTDRIRESGGAADVILLGTGYTAANVTLERSGNHDMIVKSSGKQILFIENQFASSFSSIETIRYGDGTSKAMSNVRFTLNGTEESDTLYGVSYGAGGDIINGLGGHDYIDSGDGADTVNGGAGNDYILAGGGNDTIRGGSGDDVISAGDGNDTIVYDSGFDQITGDFGIDTISITNTSMIASSMTLQRFLGNGMHLDVLFGGTLAFRILSQFTQQGSETIRFANGTTFSLSALQYTTNGTEEADYLYGISYGGNPNDIVNGFGGDDMLYGFLGNDTLDGGTGNDFLYGGEGNDTYKVGFNEGVDEISDDAGTDKILFGAGYGPSNMTFARDTTNRNDLNILFGGTLAVIVRGHFNNYYPGSVETLQFSDGRTYNLLGVTFAQSGGTNNDILEGYAGRDSLSGMGGSDTLFGYAGNDVLVGGVGNDVLYGGAGDDTYKFSVGDGLDTVDDLSGAGDTILMGTGILAGNIRFEKSSYDLKIHYGTADRITLFHHFYDDTEASSTRDEVETLKLADGTSYNLKGGLTFTGTAAADSVVGTSLNDTLLGLPGEDLLQGGGGDDVLVGGAGNDFLSGGEGNDTFKFDLSALGSIDSVADFSLAEADKLDIRDILVGYDPLTKAITDFVECATSGANTIVKVDRDGAGATYGWQQIAVIENVTGLSDELALKANGSLIV